MSWTHDVPFVGLTITFNGGSPPSKVRLVDFTGSGYGDDGTTQYNIETNRPNVGANASLYGNPFYAITADPGGNNSTMGAYGNGDVYVETNLLISLPVNLLNFSGYKNGSKNTLNWTIASESNNKGFDVLRSTDGVNYLSIGFVSSQVGGNSNSEVHYTFDDNNLSGNKQYYQLSQKDFDGRSKLSNVIILSRDKPIVLGIGGIFPNPASTLVNVMIDAPQKDNVTLLITDMAGRTVRQQQASVDVGSNTIPVDIAKLAGGTYLVKLTCQSLECETISAKFNKQ